MKASMMIDSSSDLTIINVATANRLHLSFKSQPKTSLRILGANGTPIEMVGLIPDTCLETPNGYTVLSTRCGLQNISYPELFLGQSSLSAFQASTFQSSTFDSSSSDIEYIFIHYSFSSSLFSSAAQCSKTLSCSTPTSTTRS